jgi:alpha-tubulin suppressor-like RCC1 family protein
MLVLIMVDVVPTNISSYLDPKTFVKTVLTCKTLYDKKLLHELVVKIYMSSTLGIPFNDTVSMTKINVSRDESWLKLLSFIYNRQKRYSPILTGITLSSGSEHSILLSNTGELYSWGYGILGALGHGDTRTQHMPKKINHFRGQRIIDVSCGEQHTLAVANDGQVYGWGWTSNGRLGLGGGLKAGIGFHRSLPTSIRPTIPINRVSCGGAHSLLLASSGVVFSFGKNDNGQLGTNDKKNRMGATMIHFIPGQNDLELNNDNNNNGCNNTNVRFQQIEAGQAHSMFLSTNGFVYACGCSCGGRLGMTSLVDIVQPQPIEGLFGGNIKNTNRDGKGKRLNYQLNETYAIYITAGSAHNILIDNLYRAWAFGWGGQGCLGIDRTMSIDQMIVHPTPIESLIDIPIVNASAGVSHSLFVSNSGAAFSCGFGKLGRLGLGSHTNEMRPRIIQSLLGTYKVISASAGGVHSIFITECSTVLACGWSIRGQTGTAMNNPTSPERNVNRNNGADNDSEISEDCVLVPTPINVFNSKFHVKINSDIIDNNINHFNGIIRRRKLKKETKAICRIQNKLRSILARQRFKKKINQIWVKAYDYRSGYFYYYNTQNKVSQWIKPYQSILNEFEDIPMVKLSYRIFQKVYGIKTAPLSVVAITIQKYYRGWKRRKQTQAYIKDNYEKLFDEERNAWYYYSNITNTAQWNKPKLLI